MPTLRAITRDAVRARIAETACGVFCERGFDEVTVDELAEAAGISRASFFRYFDAKEEAVFTALAHTGAEIASNLRDRPAGEDAWQALQRSFDRAMPKYEVDAARSLAQLRLARETPSLRAHQLERQARWGQLISEALAPRLGTSPDDIAITALTGAAIAALDAALTRWAASDGEPDLSDVLDEAFKAIANPLPAVS